MRILGDDQSEIGRWNTVLPPVLVLGFLVGLFLLAAAGQSRLEAAHDRVQRSQLREQALGEFVELISGAETAQRRYLSTGDDADLGPYAAAASHVRAALERLRAAYAAPGGDDPSAALRALAAQELAALDAALAPRQKSTVVRDSGGRSGAGPGNMEAILEIAGQLRRQETAESSAAAESWRSDLSRSRWFTSAGALLNIVLVLLATRLVYGDMHRRARQATDLRDQKQDLERLVEERTRELTALSTHLQGVSEQEKSALARELHDELGGLLVGARMDLSWLQQRLPTSNPAIEQRFKRIHESLSAGVDLKRRVVEELRPTLLDNMGLYAALRWQFKESCRRSGLSCSESIPEAEPMFHPDAAIGVFRIAQEALINILKHANAKSADLTVEIQDGTFTLRIADDGRGIAAHRLQTVTSHGIASMRHRVSALGGSWELTSPLPGGGTIVTARIPLARMMPLEQTAPLTGVAG